MKEINDQREKRAFWAHCYRRTIITRGDHTNNYAEAGIRILKDLVFARVKACNLVQMFYFIIETIELHYKRKPLNIANSRLESYIAVRFRGLDAKKVRKEDITKGASLGWYTVRSQSQVDKFHEVNMHIGVCTCTKGQNGSPCIHQAAVVVHFGDFSVNYIATFSASKRLDIAKLALGDGELQHPAFYASIHQQSLDNQYGRAEEEDSKEQKQNGDMEEVNFEGTERDLVRAGAVDTDAQTGYSNDQIEELCDKIDFVASSYSKNYPAQLSTGVTKFISRFDKLSAPNMRPKLASALHQFGWEMGTTTITQAGQIRHGKRIAVQATTAGRRRKVKSHGMGRPRPSE